MRSRAYFIAAVVVPLAVVFALAYTRSGSTDRRSSAPPAPLPIDAGGTGASAALYPLTPIEYRAAAGLPALDGDAPAYHVPAGTWTTGDPNGSASSGVAVVCAPDVECPPAPPTTRPAGFPTEEQARAVALDALRGAGFPVDGADVHVDDAGTAWVVRVAPVVDGRPTDGFDASVQVGAGARIEYGTAHTGAPARADSYPLIGTQVAVQRLNDGLGLIGPQPLAAGAVPAGPDLPPSGSGDVVVIEFTAVEQVLVFAPSTEGDDGWLVPAYRFHAADGTTKTVLAIDDRFIDTPPTGRDGTRSDGSAPVPVPLPSPEPAPPVTGDSGGGTGGAGEGTSGAGALSS